MEAVLFVFQSNYVQQRRFSYRWVSEQARGGMRCHACHDSLFRSSFFFQKRNLSKKPTWPDYTYTHTSIASNICVFNVFLHIISKGDIVSEMLKECPDMSLLLFNIHSNPPILAKRKCKISRNCKKYVYGSFQISKNGILCTSAVVLAIQIVNCKPCNCDLLSNCLICQFSGVAISVIEKCK